VRRGVETFRDFMDGEQGFGEFEVSVCREFLRESSGK
jgi:hypothetical protein